MTINGLKAALYERATAYWGGAAVAWAATKKVKPGEPLVILRLGTVTRARQPIMQSVNGILFSSYPSEVPLQIDLFTPGRLVETDEGPYYENTAENDLLDFVNFLDSAATIEWSREYDVSLTPLNGVRDLSDVINDSQWQYRAMAEITVAFTQWTAEVAGVLSEANIVFDDTGLPVGVNAANWRQTESGGGTQELADATAGVIETVDIPELEQEVV